jgi:hypothetical protein
MMAKPLARSKAQPGPLLFGPKPMLEHLTDQIQDGETLRVRFIGKKEELKHFKPGEPFLATGHYSAVPELATGH